MIECLAMKKIVILIHKKRDDIKEFIKEFPDTYIFVEEKLNFDNPFIVKIEHSSKSSKNVVGNGIRHIYKDFPNHHIVFVNDEVNIDDVKLLVKELIESKKIIIAENDNAELVSKRKLQGIRIITKLFNIVHKQKANNIMSNVQGIPSHLVEHFLKLKGDTCAILINERFIIKDHKLDYKYIKVKSNVFTDAPSTIAGYLKCIIVICFVFIKFMISSVSAFLVDYSLSLGGYAFWSPLIVNFFTSLSVSVPGILLDVEIVSTGVARIISSIYNYIFNKKVVFAANEDVSKLSTSCKYFTLVLIIWVFNTIILKLATTYLNIPFAFAKIIADIIMYFVSFTIQRDFIFKKSNN